jgi:hypothetical protein
MAEHFGMRPSNKQRSRNKSGNNNNNQNQNQRRSVGNIINRVFESAGPDGKVRGTPQQIIDKYQALARDAQVSGDRVAAESFLQHSEHYSRMLGEAQRHQAEQRVGQDREDGQRPEAPRYEGGRSEDGAPERGRAPATEYTASGMATIDAGEHDYGSGGLIETPEGRQAPRAEAVAEPIVDPVPEPAPEPERPMVAAINGHGAETESIAPRPPARRGRPRRTSKPGDGDAAPAPVAD